MVVGLIVLSQRDAVDTPILLVEHFTRKLPLHGLSTVEGGLIFHLKFGIALCQVEQCNRVGCINLLVVQLSITEEPKCLYST